MVLPWCESCLEWRHEWTGQGSALLAEGCSPVRVELVVSERERAACVRSPVGCTAKMCSSINADMIVNTLL